MTILSYNSNFIFVHIPKCAGTSIEMEWQRLGISWGDYVIGSTESGEVLHQIFNALYGVHKHSTAAELKAKVGEKLWRDFEICAIVREPRAIIESYFRFSMFLIDTYAEQIGDGQKSNLSDLSRRRRYVIDEIKTLDLNTGPELHVLRLMNGAVREAIISDSFGEYLERVLDERWQGYLRSYTHSPVGSPLVTHTLKLEQPALLTRFFQKYRGSEFRLRKENEGRRVETIWNASMLKRVYQICETDYLTFGYEFR